MNIKINYDRETREDNNLLPLSKSYIIIEKGRLSFYYGLEYPPGCSEFELINSRLKLPEKKPILSKSILNERFNLEKLSSLKMHYLGVEENYRICFDTHDMPSAIYFNLSYGDYWNIRFFQIVRNEISIVISIILLIISVITLFL